MSLAALISLLLVPSVIAVGSFINPSGTTTFHPQQIVEVQWTGTADYYLLSLGYFADNNDTITWLISNSPNYPTRYSWTVSPRRDGFDTVKNDQFWLYIVNGTDFGAPFQSDMFYIRNQNNTSPTTAVATETPTPASNAPSGTQTAGEGGNSSGSDSAVATGGLSTGAKAGIGVGVAVGVLLVIAALGFFFVRRRRTSKARNNIPQAFPLDDKKYQYQTIGDSPHTPDQTPLAEAPTETTGYRSELQGSVRAELEGDNHR